MTAPISHPMPTDPEVLAYLEQCRAFFPEGTLSGGLAQYRVLYDRFAAVMQPPFPQAVQTKDLWFDSPVAGQQIAARQYHHTTAAACEGVTVLYIHGGGFVVGGLDSHAGVCAGLCEQTGLDVVASTYRLAPEHGHPAQLDDVEAAWRALRARGQQVLLCGDSAGANLAAGLCIRLQAKGEALPPGQVLIYPGLGGDPTQGSYLTNAHAPMLTTQDCIYYFTVRAQGLPPEQWDHPEMRPLLATDLSGTPPTLVVTADLDPLRDDGVQYVQRLQAVGVRVEYRNEPELVHGYLRARHSIQRAATSFAAIADGLLRMAQGRF